METRKEARIPIKVQGEACKDQNIHIIGTRAVILQNETLKITGKLQSSERLWDTNVDCIITLENRDKEILHSKAANVYFSTRHGLFDLEINKYEIDTYIQGIQNLEAIGILPVVKYR